MPAVDPTSVGSPVFAFSPHCPSPPASTARGSVPFAMESAVLPQHATVPSWSSAHVWAACAASCITPHSRGTRSGSELESRQPSPTPSSPISLSPQHSTVPPENSAQLCKSPDTIENHRTGVGRGVALRCHPSTGVAHEDRCRDNGVHRIRRGVSRPHARVDPIGGRVVRSRTNVASSAAVDERQTRPGIAATRRDRKGGGRQREEQGAHDVLWLCSARSATNVSD